MSQYRIHLMGSSGFHVGTTEGSYASDEKACAHAQTILPEDGHAHVWAGSRFVGQLFSAARMEALSLVKAASVRQQAEIALALLQKGIRPFEVAKTLLVNEEAIYRLAAAALAARTGADAR